MARTKSTAHKLISSKAPREQLSQVAAEDKPPAASEIKKPIKYKPGPVALRQIKEYQNSTNFLLANKPKLYMNQPAFRRLVREITHAINPEMRMQATALDILQKAAEDYVVSVMNDPTLLRFAPQTSHVKDIQLALRLRGNGRYNL